jgi:diaminopimelate decarboxylase
MYGSYHHIDVIGLDGEDPNLPREPYIVAGPLCESGDVFTRDERELLQPRLLPAMEPGSLLALRDAGAYGYSMASNYNSIGRAPQLWVEEDGTVSQISRREGIDDIVKVETDERLL